MSKLERQLSRRQCLASRPSANKTAKQAQDNDKFYGHAVSLVFTRSNKACKLFTFKMVEHHIIDRLSVGLTQCVICQLL